MSKTKYSREFRFEIVEEYYAGATAIHLSKKYGMSDTLIKYWAKVIAIHGEASFPAKTAKYSEDFKLKALNLLWTKGWSIKQTSAYLSIPSPASVSRWLKAYLAQSSEEQIPDEAPDPSILESSTVPKRPSNLTKEQEKMFADLEQQVELLRAQVAVLKKIQELDDQKRLKTKKKR